MIAPPLAPMLLALVFLPHEVLDRGGAKGPPAGARVEGGALLR